MKRFNIFHTLSAALLAASTLLATSCTDDTVPDIDVHGKGCLTFSLDISGAVTRAEQSVQKPGEPLYNENAFKTLDVFFYTTTAGDDVAALAHQHIDNIENATVSIPVDQALLDHADKTFRVFAVANCADAKALGNVSQSTLKSTITATSEFRPQDANSDGARKAPASFVMTNFYEPSDVTVDEAREVNKGSLTFRRVAAKIRVALNVEESVVEDGKTWTADRDHMRLYISNGVSNARLDGNAAQLTEISYYNITTQGKAETSDYYLARPLTAHTSNNLTGTTDDTYTYYNDLPLYTYPNVWSDDMVEDHQTTLTIVIPWENTEETADGETETTYRPTYYRIPVNNKNEMVSNAYYYIRTHIGMMGSITPEKPMDVDMQCEIANWGTADETTADLRPLRFLIFNQKEYVLNNERSITIPFSSTHPCATPIVSVKYYDYNSKQGSETEKTQSGGYTCSVNNNNNTLTFTHTFDYSNYSRYDVTIKVRHTDQSTGSAYEQTIYITVYPPIYITTEDISGYAFASNDGWILVNGYNNDDDGTGHLGNIGHTPNGRQSKVLTTLTITQLNDEEKAKWVIGDPRTYYINNELDNTSMLTDTEDHVTTWTIADGRYNSFGGPFDGTQYSGASAANKYSRYRSGAANTCKTIWEYYTGPDWEIENSQGTWKAKEDKGDNQGSRTLKYYYPAKETNDTKNMIAPKFTMVSM
ncbi:MAG: hypothetical protein J1F25_07325, partial [Prevotellaceae bacterium]|nr:hypothetical protein [Prevotellaceae bacterium]